MQADLLMEFDKLHKMTGEKHFTQKLSPKSNSKSNQDNISKNDLDGKNFLKLVSMLIEETPAGSLDGKQVKQALERILDKRSSSSIDSLEEKKAKQVFGEIISGGDSSSILSELLPFFDTNKRPIDQNEEKGNLETLLLLFQKMSLLQENPSIQSEEHLLENGSSLENEKPIVSLEGNGSKVSNLFSDEYKSIFFNPTKINEDTSSDGNNKLARVTSKRTLQSNSQHPLSDEKLYISDSKDQKNAPDMKFKLPKVSIDSKELQSSETEKIKLFAQPDNISQNYFENKKEILKIIDKGREQKIKAHSCKLENPSATSSTVNKNVSLASHGIDFSKKDINEKIAGINGKDEHNHSSDSKGLSAART